MATINYDHHLLVADYCLCRVDTGSGWCVIFLHSSKKLTELLTLPRGVCCCCNLEVEKYQQRTLMKASFLCSTAVIWHCKSIKFCQHYLLLQSHYSDWERADWCTWGGAWCCWWSSLLGWSWCSWLRSVADVMSWSSVLRGWAHWSCGVCG